MRMDAQNEQSMMAFDPDMAEILESFLVESKELMEKLGTDLMDLEKRPTEQELLNTIFRAVHTLKGTSSFLGFQQFTELSHHFEDVLNAARRGTILITAAHIDYSLMVYDMLRDMLDDIEGHTIRTYELEHAFEYLKRLSDPQSDLNSSAGSSSTQSVTAAAPVEPIAQQTVEKGSQQSDQLSSSTSGSAVANADDERARAMAEALRSLQEVVNAKAIAAGEEPPPLITIPSIETLPQRASLSADSDDEEERPLGQTTPGPTDTQSVQHMPILAPDKSAIESTQFPAQASSEQGDSSTAQTASAAVSATGVATQTAAPALANKDTSPKPLATESTIRVDVQRLDSLMNLVGELVLGRNRFSQLIHSLNEQMDTNSTVKELLETSTHIDFITTELQAAVMKTRMVSMAKIYNKLPRLVRDLCKETGKDIDLVMSGEDTELDKTLIEELNDPFIHLLRNAADHGVESPEDREKAGKPRRGTITVKAVHAGNHIAISIADDGKGMNPEVLKNVAVAKGVITEQEAEHLSDHEAYKLIFMPGFSTAKQLTNVSGRGVGMDVVKTNIMKLKGSISIDSRIGEGSVFTIKLPLTLAIIQALLVEVKGEIYSVPLESVIEVIRLNRSDIQTIRSREATLLRGHVLPLIRLDRVLGRQVFDETDDDSLYTVVMQLGEQRVGLMVENLLGQREIVIKSLGAAFEGIRGVSGSTILGDGRVIMIIDVPEIMKLCTEYSHETA